MPRVPVMSPSSSEIDLRWRIIRVVVGGPYLLALRVRVAGLDRIPAEGPAIVAVNHVSVLDPIGVALAAYSRGRAIRFLAAAEFFSHPLTGLVLRGCGQIPIRRGTRDLAALEELTAVLRLGGLAGIFPEGRVADGRTRTRGGTGVARVARATGAPVIPVAIWGTQARWPRGRLELTGPIRTPVAIAIGEPIRVDPAATGSTRPLRTVTDQIMSSIEELAAKARLATERWVLPRRGAHA
jgi:1-acyl-sn-glycerol-3-phosphate acyltransferase